MTKRDAVDTFPFGNYLVAKELTGAQLKELFETSIEIGLQNQAANQAGDYDGWPQNSGSYLQAGGVQVRYDPDKKMGSRIVGLEIGQKPVENNKSYTVVTNNYLAESEDYPMLASAKEKYQYTACDEIFIRYLQQEAQETIKSQLQTARMVVEKADVQQQPASRPAGTVLTKLAAKSKGFQAVWKKTASVTGYQIQYAADKNFSTSTKKITVKNKATVKKAVKGLKGNKNYYVRIRTYKKSGGSNSYSKWSAVKKVKTLK